MARQPTRKDMRQLFAKLDRDDRMRVIKHAERLVEGTAGGTRESLNDEDDTGLSYVDAVDSEAYNRRKETKKSRSWG